MSKIDSYIKNFTKSMNGKRASFFLVAELFLGLLILAMIILAISIFL